MDRRSPFQRFIGELRRRRVPQTVAVYLVAAWAAIQFADVVAPNLRWPEWVVPAVIVAAGVGLPVVVVLAWIFDWGPGGIHRTAAEAEPGPDGRPVASAGAISPWWIAVAVLVVGVGSALAVAALIEDDWERPAAETQARTEPGERGEERDEGVVPGPPAPPSIIGPELSEEFMRGFADSVRKALSEAGLDSMVAQGRMWGARNLAGTAIEIVEPDTWRFGTLTPMHPGDTVDLVGIARDSSGVGSVEVDGRVVARTDDPQPSLRFETQVVAPEGTGLRTVSIVVRTGAGELRREVSILLTPSGG